MSGSCCLLTFCILVVVKMNTFWNARESLRASFLLLSLHLHDTDSNEPPSSTSLPALFLCTMATTMPVLAHLGHSPKFSGTEAEVDRPRALSTWHTRLGHACRLFAVEADSQVDVAVATLDAPALDFALATLAGPDADRPTTVDQLRDILRTRFIPPAIARRGVRHLLTLRQSARQSLPDFCQAFLDAARINVPEVKPAAGQTAATPHPPLNTTALVLLFANALHDTRLTQVVNANFPTSLDAAVTMVLGAAETLGPPLPHPSFAAAVAPSTRPPARLAVVASSSASLAAADQERRTRLRKQDGIPDTEVEHRIAHRLCIYCGQAGHRRSDCPRRRRHEAPVLDHAPPEGFSCSGNHRSD